MQVTAKRTPAKCWSVLGVLEQTKKCIAESKKREESCDKLLDDRRSQRKKAG